MSGMTRAVKRSVIRNEKNAQASAIAFNKKVSAKPRLFC